MKAALCTRSVTRCRSVRGEEEIWRRIEKTRNLVRFYRRLVPYDKEAFNAAELIWESVDAIPPKRRVDLLNVLNGWDIEKLWRLSATRYEAKDTSTATIGYSPLDDLPEDPNEVVRFEGKASVRYGILGWERFSKLLFVHPESYDIYGRLALHVPLSDALYPLYFRTEPRQQRIPATGELVEITMEYLNEQTGRHVTQALPDATWPALGDPRFPFHGDVTEYLRPVGPGCYVGVGWREPRLDRNDLGRRFWTFVLIKVSYSS